MNHLKINSDKTELLICSSRFSKSSQTCINSIQVGNDIISPSQSVKNIGVLFDRLPQLSISVVMADYLMYGK